MSISKLRGQATLGAQATNTGSTSKGKALAAADDGVATTVTARTATTTINTTKLPSAAVSSIQQLPPQQQQQQQQPSQHLPQTTLLKIEPFVPSLNARLRRPIGRSYSTLSTACLQRISGSPVPSNAGAAVDGTLPLPKAMRAPGRLRRQPVTVLARQRSKSNSSSSASNRPATAAALNGHHTPNGNSQVNGAVVSPQPNGICRITRQPQEREKLLDRINYDRRGLTAIPIFEQEPNLRLLSLQHNLINVFHIPRQVTSPAEETSPSAGAPTAAGNRDSTLCIGSRASRATGRATATSLAVSQASRVSTGTHSPTPPPPATPTRATATSHQLLKRNGMLQRHLNLNAPQLPATQQLQQQPAAQYRFGMKRSKSFMSNYTRQLGHIKRNLQQSQPLGTRLEARMLATLAGMQLQSFDSGASALTSDSTASTLLNSELDEDVVDYALLQRQQQQLEIKNKQLQPSYGAIFQQLVFLDLYDNQIERIANLDGLSQLTVLLLGKNRISDIGGLYSLRRTLRVLDLHGNKISSVCNKLNCLHQLKSLNLAGNQIRQINQNDFNGLSNLKELNLKRNRIKRINGFQHLSALERLWLCHNELHKVDDMCSIAKASNLLEVTIENNPVSLAGDCVSFLVSYLPRLQSLSQMSITDQVRRAAMAWRQHKEASEASHTLLSGDACNSIRREEVISNARTNWELLRSQQTVQAALGRHQRGSNKPPPRHELTKINESNEALVAYEELQQCIKLPPIQHTPQEQSSHCAAAVPVAVAMADTKAQLLSIRAPLCGSGGSSGSSLGPNVDSSSSSYSSDNEQSSPQQPEQQRTRIKKAHNRNTAAAATDAEAPVHGGELPLQPPNHSTADMPDKAAAESSQDVPTMATTTTAMSSDACPAAATSPSQQLTLMNCNQRDNNSSMSCHSGNALAAGLTMLLPQTAATATTTTAAATRTATTLTTAIACTRLCATQPHQQQQQQQQQQQHTTTMPIMAVSNGGGSNNSSSTLNPGFRGHSSTGAAMAPLTTGSRAAAVPATTMSTTATCRRYMPSSLMRSQTIAGNSGNTGNTGRDCGGATSVAIKQAHLCHTNTTKSNVGGLPQQPTAASMANTQAGNCSNNNNKAVAVTSSTATTHSSNSSNSLQVIAQQKTVANERERDREQGGDYLIEICGRYLNVYGQGALRFIDKQWSAAKANDVHTLNFSYINFNNIAALLSRIKARFPHAEHFVFRETNISCLGQLNALAELQGIASLCIDAEGNAITTKDLWRQYAIYRLSHWGLRLLNGVEVCDADVQQANSLYAGLSELVLWSMPDAMLQPLLARLRLDETCTASRMSPKEWLMRADVSLRLVVGKEALQWKKLQAQPQTQTQQQVQVQYYAWEAVAGGCGSSSGTTALSIRERGKMHFSLMLENTCNAVEKLHKLQTLWPSLLLEIVRNTLLDYSQLDAYLRNLMSDIMK